jgi:hypothetical protein
MTDDKIISKHEGPQQATPYPQSRLSPPIAPNPIAKVAESSISMVKLSLEGKLKLISDQIKGLQKLGEELIMEAHNNIEMHNIPCSIAKKPGDILHLYAREDGSHFLSIISPSEWGTMFSLNYLGTFKLEHDMSWTHLGDS